jgi:hypothetical protein
MREARKKLERLEPVHCLSGCDIGMLERSLSSLSSGTIIANENSMIDTDRLDLGEGVGSQAVNLASRTGNPQVLSLVEEMLANKGVSFFPGTLLENLGGYFLPVMPIVTNGELIRVVKQTSPPYVDNYQALARQLLGEEFARKISPSGGVMFEEPLKSLAKALESEVAKAKKTGFRELDLAGLRVLPAICSDLSYLADSYQGAPVDAIIHCAENLYDSREEMEVAYKRNLGKLEKRGKLRTPGVILLAQKTESGLRQAKLAYSEEKLEDLD